MNRPLRILFTNISLASRTGTEVYIKEAAAGLLRRGHTPLVYSPELGEIAEEIRATTVPVVDDLARIGAPPDVIHGHHHQQVMTALLHFPGVPAIFVTHDWIQSYDAPPLFPRIRRYVAVDWTNRDRILFQHGIPEERVRVLLNWVDLDRFPQRGPLPERPRRALVFSNRARGDTHLPAVQEACRRAGLSLEVLGIGAGRSLAEPGGVIAEHDLVFAKAKSALEALAVGTAVVLCDFLGLGQMVTSPDLTALRRLNLGLRAQSRPLVPDLILREIERYDARDAAEVSRRVREEAGLEPALDRLIALYEEVIEEHEREALADPAEELRAAAVYLREWAGLTPELKILAANIDNQRQTLDLRVRELEEELRQASQRAQQTAELEEELRQAAQGAQQMADRFAAEAEVLRAERDRFAAEAGMLRGDVGMLRDEASLVHREIAMLRQTATWRLRERLLRLTLLVKLYRFLRRSKVRERHTRTAAGAGDAAPRNPSRETARLPEGHATLEEKARRMEAEGGFLGVPVKEFETEGRLQLAALLRHGLRPDSKLLDVGCGCLRAGYWLIHFLQPGCYCGIEPRKDRLQLGLSHLFAPAELADKQPRFDHNPEFDSSVFGERFDFFLARSIWTHASKPQIARMLDAFLRDTAPAAKYLTSYMPPEPPHRPEFMGEAWIGTGLESNVPGIAFHSFEWIERECRARGLEVHEASQDDFSGQRWLLVRRAEKGAD